ncbi:5-oxoprolinase subunit PxpA [Lutimonas saemankumensis]|uniref:5-oxoprolinase subunit PxpA n=1 Tax=Lutimonas saemankumensis TaxID=483016 RepID=UPI001CD57873|nr:5-oxoprolinase subunit PxpA [Lutimonas saemankumensis]MCA0931170.1 5-oxoprolinase subunit PxpA [Lutimonas saemankumensis]
MDINCDLGEGTGNDAELMPWIDLCNIACGGHAGDDNSMIATLKLTKQHGVKPGAHPSFVDRANFGRKELKVSPELLKNQLIVQIGSLIDLADRLNVEIFHVKPHGALYNLCARSEEMASVLIEAVKHFKKDLCILVPYGSVFERLAKENGISHMTEAFADRNYDRELNLLPRSDPRAVLNDPVKIRKRALRMLKENVIETVGGKNLYINFDTLCVHGDHPKALQILMELNKLKKRT